MIKIEKSRTTINERTYEFADFIVRDLFALKLEEFKEMECNSKDIEEGLTFEMLLEAALEEAEDDFEEQKIDYELNVLEEKGYTDENLEEMSYENVERIVWGVNSYKSKKKDIPSQDTMKSFSNTEYDPWGDFSDEELRQAYLQSSIDD